MRIECTKAVDTLIRLGNYDFPSDLPEIGYYLLILPTVKTRYFQSCGAWCPAHTPFEEDCTLIDSFANLTIPFTDKARLATTHSASPPAIKEAIAKTGSERNSRNARIALIYSNNRPAKLRTADIIWVRTMTGLSVKITETRRKIIDIKSKLGKVEALRLPLGPVNAQLKPAAMADDKKATE